MRRTVVILLISVAALFAGSSQALAAVTQIGFDDLAAGTRVVDQYAGLGIHFGHPSSFGIERPGAPPGEGVNYSCTGGEGSPGVLEVSNGGISGRSGVLACNVGEFDGGYDEAIAFEYWRREVSFSVLTRSFLVGTENAEPEPLTVRLLDKNGALIERHDYSFVHGTVHALNFSRAQSEIAYVELSGKGRLFLDNLEAPIDAVPPPKAYRIALTSPTLQVYEGSTASVPIKVIRFNGSTGPVALNIAALPAGIAAAAVEPNPIGGTAPGALKVTATGPASGERQVTVTPGTASAEAGSAVNASVSLGVQIEPALAIDSGVSQVQRAIAVPGCGAVETRRGVTVRGGYSGTVEIEIKRLSGPVISFDHDNTFHANGSGRYEFGFRLSQPAGNAEDSELELKLQPFVGASPVTTKIHVFTEPVRISSIWPTSLALKRPDQGGETATLEGVFPRGCALQFKDGLGNDLDVTGSSAGGGELPATRTVELASDSTTGAITALAEGVGGRPVLATSPSLDVREMRNSSALPVPNSGYYAGATDFSWSDFIRVFGNDDSDDCTPVYCYRDPFALEYFDTIRDKLREDPGLCFGYSTMARRFDRGAERPGDYQPGAGRAWQISNVTEGTDIKNQVLRWQVSQRDTGWQEFRSHLAGFPNQLALRSALESGIRAHGSMYIELRQGDAGHAVVAYAVRGVKGGFNILTYNPNRPYSAIEQTNKSLRDKELDASAIKVLGSTWEGGVSTKEGWWKGDLSSINTYADEPPSNAAMPNSWAQTVLFGILNSKDGDSPAPQIDAIEVGGKDALNADGTAKKGSGVTALIAPSGVHPDVSYRLPKHRRVKLTVKGTGKGRYGESTLGEGAAASVDSAETAPGQRDTLTVTSGLPRIGFESGGDSAGATLSLLAHGGGASASAGSGGLVETAGVALTAGAGRADALALSGGELELSHSGKATSVAVTLGSTGAGAPQTVALAPLHVAAGQRLQLRPVSWSDLGAGVTYVVHGRGGVTVHRGRARIRPTGAVRLAGHLGVKAKRHGRGGRVIVSGRIRKPGSAPLLVVSVEALRHGHLVAKGTAALQGPKHVHRGHFSIPVKMKKLPAGTTLRVVATLTDEAADYATARATASARAGY
jgi:hypothetical protein